MTTLTTFQKLFLNFQLNLLAKKRAFAVSQNMPTAAYDRMMKPKEDRLRDATVKAEPVTVVEIDGTDNDAVNVEATSPTTEEFATVSK